MAGAVSVASGAGTSATCTVATGDESPAPLTALHPSVSDAASPAVKVIAAPSGGEESTPLAMVQTKVTSGWGASSRAASACFFRVATDGARMLGCSGAESTAT